MSNTEQAENLLRLLLENARPRLAGRFRLSVGYAERIFTVTPLGSGAHIRFGRQALRHPSLMMIVEEAAIAVEQHVYQLTTASAIRLDEEQRNFYDWWLRQQEQGSD